MVKSHRARDAKVSGIVDTIVVMRMHLPLGEYAVPNFTLILG